MRTQINETKSDISAMLLSAERYQEYFYKHL